MVQRKSASSTSVKEETDRHQWVVFFLVTAGVFLSTLDSSMINVALPRIMRTFEVSLVQVQWVVLSYLLTITTTLLFWGIAADHCGKQVVYCVGMGLFCVGSIGCFCSVSLTMLVAFRMIEGGGAAMMMASGPAIIREVFPRKMLGKALGLVGVATSLGLMTGPVVSGLIISTSSWRMIFLVVVPCGIGVLLLSIPLLVNRPVVLPPRRSRPFAWWGALLWAALVSGVMLYAHQFATLACWSRIWWLIGLGVLLLIFIGAEKTGRTNLMPHHLFSKKYYHIGLVTAMLSFATLFMVLIILPFYLDYIKQLSPRAIGLVMMSVPLTLFMVSPTAGLLFDRIGSKHLTTGGLLICLGALFLLTQLSADSAISAICWRLALLGMGQSMFLAPNTASLLSRIEDADASITSGLLATARNLGMLFGAAFAGIVFAAWFSHFSGGQEFRQYTPDQAAVFLSAFRATLLCGALFSLLAAAISWQRSS